jgi:hypothetical protein
MYINLHVSHDILCSLGAKVESGLVRKGYQHNHHFTKLKFHLEQELMLRNESLNPTCLIK